jgi:diguanylate cyclase (GGDEF)-like protein
MEAQEEVACRLRQLQGELADMSDAPELPGSTSAQLARVQQELATLATRLGPAPPPQDLQDPFPSGSHTLEGVLPQALQAARTRGEGISVLRIGLDHFPWVIDEAGPIGAEEVIRSVALRTAGILREKDLVIRTGLSDFAVVLPGTPLSAARQVAERVLKGVGRLRFTHEGSRFGVTCTVVVAQVAPQEAVDDLVGRLSSAVSEAGRDGENQVVAA